MIYAYLIQDAWGHWIGVEPVNRKAHDKRRREAERQGKFVKTSLMLPWTDGNYFHWYYKVPEKHRKDFDMGFRVRVKVDPAIFETE